MRHTYYAQVDLRNFSVGLFDRDETNFHELRAFDTILSPTLNPHISLTRRHTRHFISRTLKRLFRTHHSRAHALSLTKQSAPLLRTLHTPRQATMSDPILYEELFHITSINSAKYDRVSRIAGASVNSDTAFTLDVNTEIYPLSANDNLSLVLATTLNLTGTKDERGWRDLQRSGEQTLADQYEYVCRGKVYRIEEAQNENV